LAHEDTTRPRASYPGVFHDNRFRNYRIFSKCFAWKLSYFTTTPPSLIRYAKHGPPLQKLRACLWRVCDSCTFPPP